MKNISTLLLGLLIILVLGLWMICFEVGFNQTAVLTTFEKAPAPAVVTIGGPGQGAAAEPLIYQGRITAIKVNGGGEGYATAPQVKIEPVGIDPGTTATAVAKVENGKVVAIEVTDAGSGYYSPSLLNATGQDAGLHWKWPRPIQRVHVYDANTYILEDRLEEQQTLDSQDVILQTFVDWRINDALRFFQKWGSEPVAAEKSIRAALRDARSIIGKYTFDQLTNVDPEKLKLQEIELAIRDHLHVEATKPGNEWGIEVQKVGIKRLVLPEEVTKKVSDRMKTTRERMAEKAVGEGKAAGATIKSDAENIRKTIMAFAQRRADEIRAEGDAAAAEYYQRFEQDEEFAIFLRQIRALRETLKNNTTFLLGPEYSPVNLFEQLKQSQDEKAKTPQAKTSAGAAQ